MTVDFPLKVRALSWQILSQSHAARLGDEAWTELLNASGATGIEHAEADEMVDGAPFVRALELLDQLPGNPDGRVQEETGRMFAELWGQMYSPLVQELRGDPEKLAQIAVRELHPYLFPSFSAPRILSSGPAQLEVRFPTDLPEPFSVGLLQGFIELAAQSKLKRLEKGLYSITWRLEPERVPARPWGILARAVRLPFLTATLVPVFIGLAIAANDLRSGPLTFDWGLASLTLLGVLFFHMATNAINDYFDHRSGADEATPALVPFSGSRRLIQQGLLEPRQMLQLAVACYALGTAIGLFLVAARGTEILWLGLTGFLLGFLYTAPPVRLAHRGVGELAVAVGFGPLIVLGTYFVQTQHWSLEALLASLPVAFLIAAVLYINEFPDKHGDARVGKRTLIVRLPERTALVVYFLLLAFTYLAILLGVIIANPRTGRSFFPEWTLLGLITLPLAVKASLVLARNYRFPYRLIPANTLTILLHLMTGLLFFAGYLIGMFLA